MFVMAKSLGALVILLVLVAAGYAVTVAAGAPTSSGDPRRYVLALGDLPTGFKQAVSSYRTPEDAAYQSPISAANYRRWGFSRGYEAIYALTAQQAQAPGFAGIRAVVAVADLYVTDTGAERSLTARATICRKTPYRKLSLRGFAIGQQTFLCKARAATQEAYALYWRHGAIDAFVVAVSRTATSLPQQRAVTLVEQLANIQQRRIASSK
jgi:hypothetical protein